MISHVINLQSVHFYLTAFVWCSENGCGNGNSNTVAKLFDNTKAHCANILYTPPETIQLILLAPHALRTRRLRSQIIIYSEVFYTLILSHVQKVVGSCNPLSSGERDSTWRMIPGIAANGGGWWRKYVRKEGERFLTGQASTRGVKWGWEQHAAFTRHSQLAGGGALIKFSRVDVECSSSRVAWEPRPWSRVLLLLWYRDGGQPATADMAGVLIPRSFEENWQIPTIVRGSKFSSSLPFLDPGIGIRWTCYLIIN